MSRKTVPVTNVKDFVNFNISRADLSDEAKIPLCMLLESVLHETGNYKGFMYIRKDGESWESKPYNRRYF